MRMRIPTHAGYRPLTGHVHAGRLYGHRDYRGLVHALTGPERPYSGATYAALCGTTVRVEDEPPGLGDELRLNVWAGAEGVTCRRCRAALGAAANRPSPPAAPGVG